jgi:NitT/TauT family transport system permease protein
MGLHFFMTSFESISGLFLGSSLAIIFAVMMVHSEIIETGLYPLLIVLQAIPEVALAPLFILWFGIGPAPKIYLALIHVFFPTLVNMITGLRTIEPELLDLMLSLGSNKFKILFKVRFPRSLPYLFSSFKICAPLAVIGAMAGEWFGGGPGLGFLTINAAGFRDTSLMFAAILLMSLIGLIIWGAASLGEKLILPWHKSLRRIN